MTERTRQQAWWMSAAASQSAALHTAPFAGSFLIPYALPGFPYGNAPHCWDPAAACVSGFRSGDWRWFDAMVYAHLNRGHNVMEYSLCGKPYAEDYPEVFDEPDRARADILRIQQLGIPRVLVCATDDRKGGALPASLRVNADIIRDVMPMYEQNGVLNNDEDRQKRLIGDVREAVPAARCWLHFTPGHGSISYRSEAGGWKWCQRIGTHGLLGQGANYITDTDPIAEGGGFETTCVRLRGMVGYVVPGRDGREVPEEWRDLDQACSMFEWGIKQGYDGGIDEHYQARYTRAFLSAAPHCDGFFGGGAYPAAA